jgi:hypothetical protein
VIILKRAYKKPISTFVPFFSVDVVSTSAGESSVVTETTTTNQNTLEDGDTYEV